MTEPPIATSVVLRPIATPLPLGFLALAVSTVLFSAVQLGWIAAAEGRVAALTALAATVPLQLLSSVVGFLARDPVAATGMGVLSGTWAVVGFTTLTSPPGSASAGLGVFLLTAGIAMFVPAAAAIGSKLAPAAVMGTAGARFLVTGVYELTGSAGWRTAASWLGLLLAAVALYAALALELEGRAGTDRAAGGAPRSGTGGGRRECIAAAVGSPWRGRRPPPAVTAVRGGLRPC